MLKFMVIAFIAVLLGSNTFAQTQNKPQEATTKIVKIKVSGKCDLCKTRIEKAAKIDGVSKADWSDETKLLTLAYDPSKVNSDEVQKKIASVGHDTEKYKADDKSYNSLPGCCKYR